MKKLIILFKILLNTTFGISSFKYKSSKNKIEKLKLIGIIAVIIFSLLPIYIGYIVYLNSSYDGLMAFGQSGAIITLGIVFASFTILFFGFLYIINLFYFSNDTEHLIALPLKSIQITGAKFGVALVNEYIIAIPIILPPFIIYGVKSGAGLLYFIYSIVGMIFIPIIPLCLASIIAIVFMKITNIGKRKDLYRIISGVVGVFLILSVQMYLQRLAIKGGEEKLMSALFSENGFINIIASNFPPAAWISIALIKYNNIIGILYLLLFIAISAAFIVGFGYMGEKLFIGGYKGSQEINSNRNKVNKLKFSKETSKYSKVSAIFWREFRMLNRIPVFFINTVLPIVLFPVIFLMMYFTTGNQEFSSLTVLILNNDRSYMTSIIISGIVLFTAVANMTPPTSLSREGAEFFVSKYIPVSPSEQILAKSLHSFMLITAGNILAIATIGFILKLPIIILLMCLIITEIASVPIIEIGLIIDLFRPLLVWDNPQRAVKQNLNGILSMVFNILWVGLIFFVVGKFIRNSIIGYMLLLIIFILLGTVLYKVLINYANKRYIEIEP